MYYECSSIIIIPLFSSEESSEEKTDIHIVPGSLVPMRPPMHIPYPSPYPHPRHSENTFGVLSQNNLSSFWLSSAPHNLVLLKFRIFTLLSTNDITSFNWD